MGDLLVEYFDQQTGLCPVHHIQLTAVNKIPSTLIPERSKSGLLKVTSQKVRTSENWTKNQIFWVRFSDGIRKPKH